MNLGTARAELTARGYSRFNATPARLNAWLNTAKNRFEDFPHDWIWLKTTATGAAPLTIADVRRVRSVTDTSNQRTLAATQAEDVLDYTDTVLTTTGPPVWWYLSAETVISVYPVQASNLSVRYVKFSPELSGDSDTPLIPLRYHQTWVDLAEVETLRWGVKDTAAANALEAETQQRLLEIASVYVMMGVPANPEQFMTGSSVDS